MAVWKTTVQGNLGQREPRMVPVVWVLSTPTASWTSRRVELASRAVLVGRAIGAEGIGLPDDERVSRTHASLEFSAETRTCRLRDQSRTGTFVNRQRVTETVVREGEVVRVGNSFFLYRFEAEAVETAPSGSSELVGESPALAAVRRLLELVGRSAATVLILGESGTGKELAAKALHATSRRSGPFVPVNCAAIPEALAESQLFGHVAGAFTGARSDAPGFFRSAAGGTLFLDEIGELPLLLQPKLLRAVEERAVVPVGATRAIPCDVRIVAATNRDLTDAARFRGDLFARLSEFVVQLPPLRERREDILPILARLVAHPMPPLDPELVDALLGYDYPYNARDLRRVATQLTVRGASLPVWDCSLVDVFTARVGTNPEPAAGASPEPTPKAAGEAEQAVPSREELIALLTASRGTIADIARETGRSRKQVYRWLERYGLSLDDYRQPS